MSGVCCSDIAGLVEIGHLVLGVWLDIVVIPVEGRRALFEPWRSGQRHCSMS